MDQLKLDRTKFKAGKSEDQGNDRAYWLSKTPKERLGAAWYLICCAYGLEYRGDHKLDRTVFSMKKRE
jgi:hypothetical protein